jgi:hypothetical protein
MLSRADSFVTFKRPHRSLIFFREQHWASLTPAGERPGSTAYHLGSQRFVVSGAPVGPWPDYNIVS